MLHLYLGPMFAGKTHELMRHARRYRCVGRDVTVVNHALDVRAEGLGTHDGQTDDAVKVSRLGDVADPHQIVCVDEGQFFEDLVPTVARWLEEGREVHVSALDGDHRQRPIGSVLQLVPLADSVRKLPALCSVCAAPAPFTRLREGCQEAVGGSDLYFAVCRRHLRSPGADGPGRLG